MEARAAEGGRAVDRDRGPVVARLLGDDREPEAGARTVRVVAADERFEDALAVRLEHARAVVLDDELERVSS